MRKLLVAPLAIAALVVALVVGAVPANSATSVSVRDNFFSPKSTSVRRGATVKWTWRGRASHNVIFRTGKSQRTAKRSGVFSRTFTRAGTYHYRCTIHPGMTGAIRVR
jgi:plastocyanin